MCVQRDLQQSRRSREELFVSPGTTTADGSCRPLTTSRFCEGPRGEHQMDICGEGRAPARADLLRLAGEAGINADEAEGEHRARGADRRGSPVAPARLSDPPRHRCDVARAHRRESKQDVEGHGLARRGGLRLHASRFAAHHRDGDFAGSTICCRAAGRVDDHGGDGVGRRTAGSSPRPVPRS